LLRVTALPAQNHEAEGLVAHDVTLEGMAEVALKSAGQSIHDGSHTIDDADSQWGSNASVSSGVKGMAKAGWKPHQHRVNGRGRPGAPVGIRTPNLLIRSQMLYPLSYGRLRPCEECSEESSPHSRCPVTGMRQTQPRGTLHL
jgi:hypothetical protein